MKIYVACVIDPEQHPKVEVFADPRPANRWMWKTISASYEYPDVLEECEIEGFYSFMADPSGATRNYGFVVERDLEEAPAPIATREGVDQLRKIIGETAMVPKNFERILSHPGTIPDFVDRNDYINWQDDYDDHPGGI